VVSALCVAPALAGARQNARPLTAGAVYTQSNNPAGNTVIFFQRNQDGTLTQRGEVPTGGLGADNQPPFSFPVVDASQSVRLSPGGHLLFVVNGGDSSLSSFVITPSGPVLADHVATGPAGSLPISVDIHGNLVYVLNELSGNITGFTVSDDGTLTPIPGSTQSLSTPGPSGVAAQIGFSPDGRAINVTERLTNLIDTFPMHGGVPGPAVASPSTGHQPFGFTYHHPDDLIVTNANAQAGFVGSASSYDLNAGNTPPLTPISGPVANGSFAPCWIVLTKNEKWAFVANTLGSILGTGQDISTYAVSPHGTLTFDHNTLGTTGFTSDIDISEDGHYLYVLQPSNVLPAANTSHIDEYTVDQQTGDLTFLGSTPSNLTSSLSGLAAK
jgi:6-phosphogluconolactonase (cycloisomerase 2 family)